MKTYVESETAVVKPSRVVANKFAKVEMLLSSLVGLWASLVLSVDAIAIAKNPSGELSCDLSEKISCTTVALSPQANLLGFPNAFLGMLSEPVVITIAVALLAGVMFPRWFMISAQVMYSVGFIFAYWLFFQAYFVIGALCPWCLLITFTTTLVFTSITRVNVTEGNLGEKAREKLEKFFRIGGDYAFVLVLFSVLAAMIITRYL